VYDKRRRFWYRVISMSAWDRLSPPRHGGWNSMGSTHYNLTLELRSPRNVLDIAGTARSTDYPPPHLSRASNTLSRQSLVLSQWLHAQERPHDGRKCLEDCKLICSDRSTYPRPDEPTARARTARSVSSSPLIGEESLILRLARHPAQGHPVQGRQSFAVRPGKASL
jgi:hypothetical protein